MPQYKCKRPLGRVLISTQCLVFLILLGPCILICLTGVLDYSSSSSVVTYINDDPLGHSYQAKREDKEDYLICPLESHSVKQDINSYSDAEEVHKEADYTGDSSTNYAAENISIDSYNNCVVVPAPVDLCVEHHTLYRQYVNFYNGHSHDKYPYKSIVDNGSRHPFLKLYRLCGLRGDGSTYEVRASFMGSPPVSVSLTLFTVVRDNDSEIKTTEASSRRKLLDVEKLMFKTPKFQQYKGKKYGATGKINDKSTKYSYEGMHPYEGQRSPVKRYHSIQEAIQEIIYMPLSDNNGHHADNSHYTQSKMSIHTDTDVLSDVQSDEGHANGNIYTLDDVREASLGYIPSNGELYCVVTAHPKGVALETNDISEGVLFNIKLERMYLTQFPKSVILHLFGLAYVLIVLIVTRGIGIMERAVKVATDLK